MNLLFVGPATDNAITAMTTSGGLTYTACGNVVTSYKRGREVHETEIGVRMYECVLTLFTFYKGASSGGQVQL
jgi:hypothetical protein